jgi:hypothetical protein
MHSENEIGSSEDVETCGLSLSPGLHFSYREIMRVKENFAIAMKPRYIATLALVGWSFWVPSVGKATSRDCPNCAVCLVAENLAQAADNEAGVAETQTVEDVRQRHLPDMLKIPHVVNMGIELNDSQTIFNVQADKEEDVPQVERMTPSKIEGYDVEVEAVPTGPAVGLPAYGGYFKPDSQPDGL